MRARSFRFVFPVSIAASLATVACDNTPPVVAEPEDSGLTFGGDGGSPFGGDASSPSDGSTGDATTRDGSAPTPDATTGTDGAAGGDAGTPDGATTDGPTSGPLTILVTTANGPEPGVTVLFQDATGAVVTSATTDATGSVKQTVMSGSGITAVFGTAEIPSLVSILAVEPGDTLTILDTTVPPIGAGQLVTATALPSGAPSGTTSFSLFAGTCQTNEVTPPLSLTLEPGCVAGKNFPLLATANDTTGAEIAFTFQKQDAPLADGGATDDAGAEDVTLGGTWSQATPQAVSVVHTPSNVNGGIFAYGEISGGVAYEQTRSLSDAIANADAGNPGATFPAHTGYPDFVQTEVSALVFDPNVVGGAQSGTPLVAVATRAATGSSAATIDLGAAPPLIISSSFSFEDPIRPTASWTTASAPQGAAGSVLVLSWFKALDDGGEQLGTWTVVAPPTMTTVQVPSLGSNGDGPSGSGVSWNAPVIAILSGSLVPDYGALRSASGAVWSQGSTLLSGYNNQPVVPPLPANGTIQASVLVPYGD